MALDAGTLSLTLEYAKDLKDMDWFGKMDPYAIIKCGTQTVRSKTHVDGGRHPVWAQTFEFNIINENTVEISLFDEDTLTKDDHIGIATISLAKTREQGADKLMAPVMTKKGKQHGYVQVSMTFKTNAALRPAAPQQPMMMQQPVMMQQQVPYGYAPMPGGAPVMMVPGGYAMPAQQPARPAPQH
mmetsp:Transcript_20875/g.53096  ORF Transcript_20875/g.53096 Transcript_20875/m.53096 type:complete len:185 (-) Transcript_20875:655-1209(-)